MFADRVHDAALRRDPALHEGHRSTGITMTDVFRAM
jgi:hypothetical protein